MHHFMFLPGAPLYKAAHDFFSRIDGTKAETPVTEVEYFLKFLTSRCRRCGDCTLAEMAFLCPQSQCAKFLFNGQCGGSNEGWCEVFPGKKKCIYVRAYDRLKSFGEEKSLKEGYLPPRNWALDQTSSWTNYFLRTRSSRREVVLIRKPYFPPLPLDPGDERGGLAKETLWTACVITTFFFLMVLDTGGSDV